MTTTSITHQALAHIDSNQNPHLLIEHLQSVAALAAEFAARFDSSGWAELAGKWHDLGKYAANFQKMIREENGIDAHIEGDTTGPRDHSTAGAVHAMQTLGNNSLPIAFAIAGHHAGLADKHELDNRLRQKACLLDKTKEANPPPEILSGALPSTPSLLTRPDPDPERRARRIEMWIRMLFSCLCDADFLDTEAFFNPQQAALRNTTPPITALEPKLSAHLQHLQQNAPPSEVNRVRADVLQACLNAASLSPGAFSLTVPTGGGKTLSSIAFALAHARIHKLERIIVAIPFTSIIEQNARVYRDALGDDAVIEHHSAFDPKQEHALNRLASENWDAPLIVTTTVQLFESLFANRPSACRKLHRLANSVIILDEAQSLPRSLLQPIVDALATLISDYGSSLVISTATQPALGTTKRLQYGLENIREIVPPSLNTFQRLERVRVRWPLPDQTTPFEELAQEAAQEQDVLVIVHKRDDAQTLCKAMDQLLGHTQTVHLSALMCPEHRSQILKQLMNQKQAGKPVRAVSTQLVEAGVDVDFAIVYRALGGMDAMAQAAGRCNREGKLPSLGELRVFRAETKPPCGVPCAGLEVSETLLTRKPDLDLFSPQTHLQFFRELYASGNLDAKKIQEKRVQKSFREVATLFKIIEDDWSAPMVVPYGNADKLIWELEKFGPSRQRLRSLQRFTIAVPVQRRQQWQNQGICTFDATQTLVYLKQEFAAAYDLRFGLMPDRAGIAGAASLIA